MGYRINERNAGHWSLDSEPKHITKKSKKINRSFTEHEFEILRYFVIQIANNLELDATDKNNQVYHDNGNILIQFSRDDINDVWSLLEKLK